MRSSRRPRRAKRRAGSTPPATRFSARIWTYLGTPAITLPLLQSEAGLPIGVQLVGRRGDDARLLRTARSLVNTMRSGERSGRKNATAGEATAHRGKKRKAS